MATTAPPRVALITGAARRIGAAIARALHAAGYDVALHHRHSHADAQALAAELEARRPGSTLLLQADLAQFDRLPELVAQTVGRFGRLDALVNNASQFAPTPLGTTTPAQWDDLFASNARAPFFLAQAAAPHLQARPPGRVQLTRQGADHHGLQAAVEDVEADNDRRTGLGYLGAHAGIESRPTNLVALHRRLRGRALTR